MRKQLLLLVFTMLIYCIYDQHVFNSLLLTTTERSINLCSVSVLNLLDISFCFHSEGIICRRNDWGEANLKAEGPCQMAEGKHPEIRSYIHQNWPAVLHEGGHSSSRIRWPVVRTSGKLECWAWFMRLFPCIEIFELVFVTGRIYCLKTIWKTKSVTYRVS